MRIAQFLRLATGQIYQPGLGLGRDGRLLTRLRPVVECCQRTIGDRPLDAALDGLMMHPESPAHSDNDGSSRYASSMRARSTRLAGSVRDRAIAVSRAKSSSSIDNSKTCRHAVRIFSLVLRITNEVTTPCRHEESDANNQFQGIERLVLT